ncbi:MAG: S41 family peptidase, partial [Pseudobdellovibrionaceae bacterium]
AQIKTGTQVLEIDGLPALSAIKDFGTRISSSSEKANLTEASEDFFLRTFAYPKNQIVSLKLEVSGQTPMTVELPWLFYVAKGGDFLESPLALDRLGFPTLESTGVSQLPSRQGLNLDQPVFPLTQRKDYDSLDEEPVLTTGEFELSGHKLCYLQIRSFDIDWNQGVPAAILRKTDSAIVSMDTVVAEFLAQCQATTESLVLDLRNNRGGNGLLAEDVGLMLEPTDSPSPGRSSAMRLTSGNLSVFQSSLDGLTLHNVRQKFLLEALSTQDKDTLTPWITLQKVDAERGIFNKPILTLISEKCFSACEMMVNRLQLQNRSLLVGSPTHGTGFGFSSFAKGETLWRDSFNLFSMRIPNYAFQTFFVDETQSEKVDDRQGQMVPFQVQHLMENRPRKPDVLVEYSPEDLRNNLSSYRSQIERILFERVLPPIP